VPTAMRSPSLRRSRSSRAAARTAATTLDRDLPRGNGNRTSRQPRRRSQGGPSAGHAGRTPHVDRLVSEPVRASRASARRGGH
jgi:hypothetical protein